MANAPSKLLTAVDLAGTFVFALEGATAAIAGNLDFFGLLVLSFVTALAGGVIRDLLIGDVPPAAIRTWRYATVAFFAATTVFLLYRLIAQVPLWSIMVLDAAGLGLFAIAGTEKALEFHMHPFIAILLGTVTGVGGGTVRDVLLAQVPTVLRADVYATAALAGSATMIGARKLGLNSTVSAVLGGAVCFLLRVVSVWQHWNLPKVGSP